MAIEPKSVRYENMVRGREIGDYALSLGFSSETELTDYLRDLNSEQIFLDLGAGKGAFIEGLKEIEKINAATVGVERFPDDVKETTNMVQADFAALPFPNDFIDRAVSVASLGYYAESEDELKRHFAEVFRVLKPGSEIRLVLNPKVSFGALGDEDDPNVIRFKKEALSADKFKVIKPSLYNDKRNSERIFDTDLLSIIKNEGFEIEKKEVTKGGVGMLCKLVVTLRKPSV